MSTQTMKKRRTGTELFRRVKEIPVGQRILTPRWVLKKRRKRRDWEHHLSWKRKRKIRKRRRRPKWKRSNSGNRYIWHKSWILTSWADLCEDVWPSACWTAFLWYKYLTSSASKNPLMCKTQPLKIHCHEKNNPEFWT